MGKVLHKNKPIAGWKRGCTGKVRHETSGSARDAMSLMAIQEPEKQFNVYRCKHCGKWHVGSKD